MHRHFFTIISQNHDYVQTHCKDRKNTFHFGIRERYLYNNPQCWYKNGIITLIQKWMIGIIKYHYYICIKKYNFTSANTINFSFSKKYYTENATVSVNYTIFSVVKYFLCNFCVMFCVIFCVIFCVLFCVIFSLIFRVVFSVIILLILCLWKMRKYNLHVFVHLCLVRVWFMRWKTTGKWLYICYARRCRASHERSESKRGEARRAEQ